MPPDSTTAAPVPRVRRLRRRSPVEVAMVALASGDDASRPLHALTDTEWAQVPAVAEFHGLTLLVNAALSDGVDAPLQVRQQIAEWSRRAAMADLRTEAELAMVAEALDASGSRWLTFKGPALASRVYRTPNLRTYGDLDVLVEVDSLGRAIDSLTNIGAVPRDTNFAHLTALGRAEFSLDLPGGTEVDLHWHPVAGAPRARMRWPATELLDRRRHVQLAPSSQSVVVPDRTDQLLMLATHHTLSGGIKLIWCRDILELLANDPPDWPDVVERAQRWRIGMPVAAALRRAALTVGAPVPAEVVDALGGGGWWAVLTALEAVSPAGLAPYRHLRGAHPIGATRDTTAASFAALVGGLFQEHRPGTAGGTLEEYRTERGSRETWINAARASEVRARD